MPGKFEIFKDRKGEFRFRLKATNGQIILASEGYTTKASCMNGVKSVMTNAGDAQRFDKKQTKAGFRFNMMAKNKKVIGVSELYTTERARDNGVASVGRNAPNAKIDDLTVAAVPAKKAAAKKKAASKKKVAAKTPTT